MVVVVLGGEPIPNKCRGTIRQTYGFGNYLRFSLDKSEYMPMTPPWLASSSSPMRGRGRFCTVQHFTLYFSFSFLF